MKKGKFSESQIVSILKEAESGVPIVELCRTYGISDVTFYKWRSKYHDIEAADIKSLKALQEENRRLKQMYADLSLEHRILQDIVEKKL